MSNSQARQRSQRKASSLATAAITLQSTDDYGGAGGPSRGAGTVTNRILTVKERQQLEEEAAERREKERASKRRKVQRRLDELERTNPKDPLGSTSSSTHHAATNRNDGEAFSIPNSAVSAAVTSARNNGGGAVEGIRADSSGGNAASSTHPTVRRLVLYRRNFHTLLESAAQSSDVFKRASINYLSASSVAEKARQTASESRRHRKIRKKFKRSDAKSLLNPVYAPSSMTFSRRPIFCTICGDSGQVFCPRCGDRTCVKTACLETHNDTRCDRPIR